MNCEQMNQMLSAWLDGEVTPQEEEQMTAHLERCPDCRALFEQLQTLHTLFSESEEIPAPEGFADAVMERIRAEEKPKIIPLFKRPQVRALMGLAACLILFIGVGSVALPRNAKSESAVMDAPAAAAPQIVSESESFSLPASEPAAPAPTAKSGEVVFDSSPAEKAVEAPAAPAPMMPEAPAEPVADGVYGNGTEHLGEIILNELPEAVATKMGELHWEERIGDGLLCAQLSEEQAHILLELADSPELDTQIITPGDEIVEEWVLVLRG